MHITQVTPATTTLASNQEAPPVALPDSPDRCERYLRVLDDLIAMGAELAAIAHRVALATPTQDPGPSFTRLARVLGQTVSLAARILRQHDRQGTLTEQADRLKNAERDLHRRRAELRRVAQAITQRTPLNDPDADRLAGIQAGLAIPTT